MQNGWDENRERERDNVIRSIKGAVRAAINRSEHSMSDDEVRGLAEKFVLEDPFLRREGFQKKRQYVRQIFSSLRSELDILQHYVEDETVNEIMVNGISHIFVEKGGTLMKAPEHFSTQEELEELIRRIAGKVHREINELSPILDARLSDGSRVNAVYKNIALDGPILTIRKFPRKRITVEELIECGTLSEEAAMFLKKMVLGGINIFISGGTSSGKTTFLNVLSDFIPKKERVIVIEDSAELQISGIKNLVRMETKSANVQGKGQITAGELIRASLRMRPDRIIVGEVRGGEVVDMLQAMNTGHDGSLSTGHGNSPDGMLRRMEAMFLSAADFPLGAIRAQIAEAVDMIVHLGRMPDKSRKVLEITEITGVQEDTITTNPLYRYRPETGLMPTGNRMKRTEKLMMRGIDL